MRIVTNFCIVLSALFFITPFAYGLGEVTRSQLDNRASYISDKEYSTLAAADAAAVASGKQLVISKQWNTVPATIAANTRVIPGGKINNAGAVTFSGVFDAGLYPVFIGAGSVTLSSMSYPEWFGSGADMGAAIQKAVNSSGKITLRGNYSKSVAVTVPANRVIYGLATVTNTADNINGFTVTGSNVTFRDITVVGPQYAAQSSANGFYAAGADSSHYLTNINLINCGANSWGIYGVYFAFVDGFKINDINIDGCFYAGIMGISVQNGVINKGSVKNITGNISSNAYGVALSRNTLGGELAVNPRSKNVIVDGVNVDNVPAWEGLDTHSGDGIVFVNCITTRCKNGVVVTDSKNAAGTPTYAPINCAVINCNVDSGVTDGSATYGIAVTGAPGSVGASVQLATGCRVIGNRVYRYGTESSGISGALYFRDTKSLIVASNQIIEPSPNGIAFYHDNFNFVCANNTITDVWSNTAAVSIGVNISNDYNYGVVVNGTFNSDVKGGVTHLNEYAVRNNNYLNAKVTVAQNMTTNFTNSLYDASTGKVVFVGGPFTASKTYDPPSINNGATATTTITNLDCVIGNTVIVGFSQSLGAGVTIRGEVTGTNVVTVTISNNSGGAVDLASGTLTAIVFK